MQTAKNPVWNLDHPEEKLIVENGEIEITKPTSYQDKELSCTFTIDASTDFIPPSNFYTIIRILVFNFHICTSILEFRMF